MGQCVGKSPKDGKYIAQPSPAKSSHRQHHPLDLQASFAQELPANATALQIEPHK
jgi:hypothetical protein